jgi:hypothetical protein
MNKNDFLNTLAQKGYDIGFGAKKNFASYDIINKLPSWVGFISLAIGIIQIAYENIPFNKELSILLIFVGIAILYIEVFKDKAEDYNNEGIRLTRIFNSIRDLYFLSKSDNNFNYQTYEAQYQNLLNDFYSNNNSKQVFMSQWFGHYKLFYEMQVQWFEDELQLKFFKDKVPNSLKTLLLIISIIILTCIFYEYRTNIQGLFN